jgi:hypothetical protein
MDTWEVNPLTLSTLLVTVLTLLGIVVRGVRKAARTATEVRERLDAWNAAGEAHPSLQQAVMQQAQATAALTEQMATMAATITTLGGEFRIHVATHRELTRQVDDIHRATAEST